MSFSAFFKQKEIYTYLFFLIFISFPLFLNLGSEPIYIWDEGRLAVNALEMAENGNFITTFFEGQPDMWNTKPPLMIWLQVLFLKTVGYNELAVRLPSALAALTVCVFIMCFLKKTIKDTTLPFFIGVMLVTSPGYIEFHTARAGDYDSLLTLLSTLYCIIFFLYIEKGDKKYILFVFITLALAVLCKSVAGMLYTPALVLYTFYRKKLIVILKDKYFYIGLSIFVITIASYYLLREHYNPGYLKAVNENDIGGRYNQVQGTHRGDNFFYLERLIKFQFPYWYFFIPGIITGLFLNNNFINKLTIFLSISTISYLIIITISSTKIDWYDMPVFPLISIICSLFFWGIYKFIINNISSDFKINSFYVAAIIFCLVFLKTYYTTIDKIINPIAHGESQYGLISGLKDLKKNEEKYTKPIYLFNDDMDEYFSPLNFYEGILKKENISLLKIKDSTKLDSLKCGDIVICNKPHVYNYISRHYSYNFKDYWPGRKYEIMCYNTVKFNIGNLLTFPSSQKELKEKLPEIFSYLEFVNPGIMKKQVITGAHKTIMDGFSYLINTDTDMLDPQKYQERWAYSYKNNIDSRTDILKQYGFPDSIIAKHNIALYLFPHAVYWAE